MNDMQNKELKPLMVSINCLAYNHGKFIRETLEGFAMQKTNFRFEAIVHDDASTDNTAEIIREYAEKYPDIIKPIYEKENQYSKKDGSLERIMNEACKGKYIAICEGDDYWTDPYKLQKQVDFLETHSDYVICSHNFRCYIQESDSFESWLTCGDTVYDWNAFISRENWLTQPLTCLYRSSAFNLDEYLQYKNSKDVTLFYYLLKKGKGMYFKDYMGVYRIHNGGVWSGASGTEQLYAELLTLKGIYDVERSYDSARALHYCIIKSCDKFDRAFIMSNKFFLFGIWCILFRYFGFSSIKLIIHICHLKKKILFWKKKQQ